MAMDEEAEVKELEKNRRLSARAIPIYACMLVAAGLLLFTLNQFVSIPIWIMILVVGITGLTLVGDIYNYFYCGKRLKRLRKGKAA